MGSLPILTTITSEIALALQPILIKQINTGLPTMLLGRLGVYSILGYFLSDSTDKLTSWGSLASALHSSLYGIINLFHIAASYISYEYLPAGSALALFYMYPFFNIIAGILFLNEAFDPRLLPLFIVAFIGVLLIAFNTSSIENFTDDGGGIGGEKGGEKDEKNKKSNTTIQLGILASLAAALTETIIFLVVKTAVRPTPWLSMLQLYPVAFLGIFGWIFFKKEPISNKSNEWIPILIFNAFIGFIGYALRFFSMSTLPTSIYSLLTFIGVAAGYGWGLFFANEKPSPLALMGAGCITGSLGVMRYMGL
jgi:drug/metabolite transporter (DMT)-like permease